MELKSVLLCPQVRTTGPYRGSLEFWQSPDVGYNFNILTRLLWSSWNVLFPSGFSTAFLCVFISPSLPTFSVHLWLLHCMTFIFGLENKIWSFFSFCNVLHIALAVPSSQRASFEVMWEACTRITLMELTNRVTFWTPRLVVTYLRTKVLVHREFCSRKQVCIISLLCCGNVAGCFKIS
jgi:FlaA1/EpsC-like NDP-sugar epimerase